MRKDPAFEKRVELVFDKSGQARHAPVDADIEGDTLMPQFDLAQWRERSAQAFSADDRNPYAYKLTVYDRM